MPFCSFIPPPNSPRAASAFFFQHAGNHNSHCATPTVWFRSTGVPLAAVPGLGRKPMTRRQQDGSRCSAGAPADLIVVSLRRVGSDRMLSLPSEHGGRALARNYSTTPVLTHTHFGAALGSPPSETNLCFFTLNTCCPGDQPICFTFIYNPGRI